MRDSVRIAGTFVRARWGMRFRDRDSLLRWQQRRIAQFLRVHVPRAPYYRAFGGLPLHRLPIVDKSTVLTQFEAFNTRGITFDRAVAVALAAERCRDFHPTLDNVTVGLSSGTSGTRGVFLVGAGDRQRWAGLILARLLTADALRRILQPWKPALRIAFFLRANSNLYESVASRRLQFTFYDLLEPLEDHVRGLNAEQPHVVIGPPTVLRRLAAAALDGSLQMAPSQVVSVAEVIEADDRVVIHSAFDVPIQEVYQATEGFLAASCAAGRLHLNEEFMHVEPEWLDDEHRRFRPLVTDFSRTTQLMVRYRLDDVLRDARGPCPCGRVTRSLEAVEGRHDDVLWCPSPGDAAMHPVFPDVLRRSMSMADWGVRDYRIEQRGSAWSIRLDADEAGAADAREAVRSELETVCRQLRVQPPVLHFEPWVGPQPHEKRRRICCVERPEPAAAIT